MKKQSLAFIKKDFHSLGGLEKVTTRLVNVFMEKGVHVAFYTMAKPTSTAPISAPLFHYQPQGLLSFQKLKDFDRWVTEKTARYSTIFSMDRCSHQTHHRAGSGVHAAYLDIRSQREGRLRRLSFQLNPMHRVQLELEKKTFESSKTQVIVVNSEMVRNQILTYYRTPPSKIHVIHNGVEWKELEADFNDSLTQKKKYATELGLDPSVFQFLFIGHNFKRKGVDVLLEALSLVRSKNFHLSIVGTDKNIQDYQLLAKRLHLETQVTFFGAAPSTKPYYLAADALVIPSLYDPFANVTVEALALGLFVVSSKMNGGHEVLQPHAGVVVEDAQDPEQLAAALETALANPKEPSRAPAIRSTISHLDYSYQLEKICNLCLG